MKNRQSEVSWLAANWPVPSLLQDHYTGKQNCITLVSLYSIEKGMKKIYNEQHCTYHENEIFSYRKSRETGRIASLIWMDSQFLIN